MFAIRYLMVVLLLLAFGTALAQPTEEWVALYNGPGNSTDVAYAMALDAAGNVYVTGESYDSGTRDDYVTLKYDPSGNELWVTRYNGPGNDLDEAYALALDAAGNVYITGKSYGSGTDWDYATLKYDPNGNELWVARYDGPSNSYERVTDLAVDAAGNAYVTGLSYNLGTSSDYATVKYDPNGNELWTARYDGPANGHDEAFAITLDAAGNVYVTGYTYGSDTSADYTTIKYDPNGNELWVARYNGPGNDVDEAHALTLDAAGNIYVTGSSRGSGTSSDYATVKYDPDGNEVWAAFYNGTGDGVDEANALTLDADGNIYVTGYSYGVGSDTDYCTVKYDPNGNELWAARYNGTGNSSDHAWDIALDAAGDVYITGFSYGSVTNADCATIKYGPNGNELWVERYNGPGNEWDYAYDLEVDASGNVYVAGTITDANQDCGTIKYSQWALEITCDIPDWRVCNGGNLYFSVTYTNWTGSPINTVVTLTGYQNYFCFPEFQLLERPRNRTIPVGTTTYYYFLDIPTVNEGPYSMSLRFDFQGDTYSCCHNADIADCDDW